MLYLFILQCNPDFSELVGTRKLVNILPGGSEKSGIYLHLLLTVIKRLKKPWVWEIGLLYYFIRHVANASFKQGVEILLMPKIDKAHKNYLTPEI